MLFTDSFLLKCLVIYEDYMPNFLHTSFFNLSSVSAAIQLPSSVNDNKKRKENTLNCKLF